MAFSLKHHGSAPLWGVKFDSSPATTGAAIITSATFSASSQKYETVGEMGSKIGALIYDSECSFTIQATLLAGSAQPDAVTPSTGVFLSKPSSTCAAAASATETVGRLAVVAAPAWLFSAEDGSTLYPVIDSAEFSMSSSDARSASLSGTIYSF